MFALVHRLSDGSEQEIIFRKDVSRIGRDDQNDLALNDASVSLVHAEIFMGPRGYILRDLESSNGTFVNDERIRERELDSGDIILLGNSVLEFRYRRRASDTNLQSLIQQTLGEMFEGQPKPQGVDTTQPTAQHLMDRTVCLERAQWDIADLGRMARWCTQDQLLLRALDLLRERVDLTSASVVIRDASGQFHRAVWSHPDQPETPPRLDLAAAGMIFSLDRLLIEDARGDTRLEHLGERDGVGSLAGICFVCGKDHQGLLYMERAPGEPPLQADDLAVAEAAAERLGPALEALWRSETEANPAMRREMYAILYEVQRSQDTVRSSMGLMKEALASEPVDSLALKAVWEILEGNLDVLNTLLASLKAAIEE